MGSRVGLLFVGCESDAAAVLDMAVLPSIHWCTSLAPLRAAGENSEQHVARRGEVAHYWTKDDSSVFFAIKKKKGNGHIFSKRRKSND